jgi:hypothetical protein
MFLYIPIATYFKENPQKYISNYHVLIFLISVIFVFSFIIWDRGSTSVPNYNSIEKIAKIKKVTYDIKFVDS